MALGPCLVWICQLSKTKIYSLSTKKHIRRNLPTLARGNIDRLEETLSGEGTSHRVNGIAVQARHFGPQLPPDPSTQIVKTKKRSVEALDAEYLPIYSTGERCGPRSRRFCRSYLWVLVQLHADAKQKVSGWTGFNISVRNKVEFRQDSVMYLPTINAPATNMSTVHEVLVRSFRSRIRFNWRA